MPVHRHVILKWLISMSNSTQKRFTWFRVQNFGEVHLGKHHVIIEFLSSKTCRYICKKYKFVCGATLRVNNACAVRCSILGNVLNIYLLETSVLDLTLNQFLFNFVCNEEKTISLQSSEEPRYKIVMGY